MVSVSASQTAAHILGALLQRSVAVLSIVLSVVVSIVLGPATPIAARSDQVDCFVSFTVDLSTRDGGPPRQRTVVVGRDCAS